MNAAHTLALRRRIAFVQALRQIRPTISERIIGDAFMVPRVELLAGRPQIGPF